MPQPPDIEAFGHRCLSLRAVKAAIAEALEADPTLIDKPLWTGNIPPVHRPLRLVSWGTAGMTLLFENGGN